MVERERKRERERERERGRERERYKTDVNYRYQSTCLYPPHTHTQPRTLSGGDSAKVKELEAQLLETRMLYTTTLDDYNMVSWLVTCSQYV